MKILVTGGGGFAGLHLLRELVRQGGASEVMATVLGEAPGGVPPELGDVRWCSMDLCSDASVREAVEAFRPDRVYHLAAQASVGESFEAPLRTWEVNATGTLRVIAALAGLPAARRRMLLISSAEVYGAVEREAQPIAEDVRFRPVTPYGASKAAAELAAFPMARVGGVEVVVARSFNHIGPGQDERFVLPSIALQLARMKSASSDDRRIQVGNLEVERDFLDVRDAVQAYLRLMNDGEAGRAYNVSSGVARSLEFVIRRLVEISGTGATIEVDADRLRPVDIPLLVGDSSDLRELGWAPAYELDRTLHDLLVEAEARA